jgi:lysophospholipid acyltransferase (LPLAT)-like uncharacterized protein
VKRVPAWLPPVVSGIVRAWGTTWRVRESYPPELDPRRADRRTRCVYLFWHRTILMAARIYAGAGACAGISQHGDGELAARVAERLGFRTARGSSTRGGPKLVRAMVDFAATETGDIALTPDGPKGPPQQAKPGALFLAAHLGWPVVPVAFVARPRKELRSWDRFVIPWPFARIAVVAAPPLTVERDPPPERLAELCREVDRRMAAAESDAEALLR